jgi:hypothetical protein
LLKEDRNNLSLWNAYAQHEKSHNKIPEVRENFEDSAAHPSKMKEKKVFINHYGMA